MAKYRQIHMEMWGDPHFEAYSPDEKLIFIYLITNNLTRESGIYPISLKRISNDTGICLKTVDKLFAKGSLRNVYYDADQKTVLISNFRKFNGGGRPEFIFKAIQSDFEKTSKSCLWRIFNDLYPEFELEEKLTVCQPLTNGLPRGTEIAPSIQYNTSQCNSIQGNTMSPKDEDLNSVIEYLNQKTGKDFKLIKTNRDLIKPRIVDGYTVEDCKKAIDNCLLLPQFQNEGRQYLRPITIFAVKKFPGYLNAAPIKSEPPRPKKYDPESDMRR